MLPTDWGAPGTSVLNRLNDRRVRQFWDPNRIIATVIKKAEGSGQVHPDCCVLKGFFWDLAAAYAPGSRWGDTMPEPLLLNGPVVENAKPLEAIVEKSKQD
jgi:hypothetical protein